MSPVRLRHRLIVAVARTAGLLYLIVCAVARVQAADPIAAPTVALGGIGAGTIRLRSDMTLGAAVVSMNDPAPVASLPGSFAAIWTDAGGRRIARVLASRGPGGLPCVTGLTFTALGSQATVAISDSELPVAVRMRVLTPMIPNDLAGSSLPAAIWVVTVTNQSRAPVDASVLLSWQSMLGAGWVHGGGAFAVPGPVEARELPWQAGAVGLAMEGPPIPRTGEPALERLNARGSVAILAETRNPSEVTRALWDAAESRPSWWPTYEATGALAATGISAAGRPASSASAIAVRFALRDRETREVAFVVSWRMARWYASDGAEYGRYYQRTYADAEAVARRAMAGRLSAAALTDEWQSRWLRSTLPLVVSTSMLQDAAPLGRTVFLSRDDGRTESPGPAQPAILADGLRVARPVELATAAPLISAFCPAALRRVAVRLLEPGAIPAAPHAGVEMETWLGDHRPSLGSRGDLGAAIWLNLRLLQTMGDSEELPGFWPLVRAAVDRGLSLPPGSPAEEACWAVGLASAARLAVAVGDTQSEGANSLRAAEVARTTSPGDRAAGVWMALSAGLDGPWSRAEIEATSAALNRRAAGDLTLTDRLALAALEPGKVGSIDAARVAQSPQGTEMPGGLWAIAEAAAGASYDSLSEQLTLTPAMPLTAGRTALPIFAPRYWGWLEYHHSTARASIMFSVHRVLSGFVRSPATPTTTQGTGRSGLRIRRVVFGPGVAPLPEGVLLDRDALPGVFSRDDSGRVTFTPVEPVDLTAGRRIEFRLKP